MQDSIVPGEPPPPEEFALCFKRIGYYMFVWACIESALNRLITTVMDLGSTEGVIVCANIQVRDKLYIAETAIALQVSRGDTWQKKAKATIKKARKLSEDRNVVAHNFFAPEGDGIQFFVRKAKGKLQFPEVVWSAADYKEKIDNMRRISSEIEEIAKQVKPPQVGVFLGIGGSYADSPPPRQSRGLLSAAYRASHQVPEDQHGPGASPPLSDQSFLAPLSKMTTLFEDWAPPPLAPEPPPATERRGAKKAKKRK